ncbi:MAG: hypothetical protein ACXVEF_04530 [Polyangiales bacterium]
MRRLVLALIFAGCDAPYVEIAPAQDTSVSDTDPDAYVFPEASVTLPDGAICSGHNEDGDRWPDSCDDCPGIHESNQDVGEQGIGTACEVGGVAGGTYRRVFFDPLTSLGDNWISGGPVAFGVLPESPDKLTGGSTTSSMALALAAPTFDTKTPLVVTAAIEAVGSIAENRTGVFLHASPGGDSFVGCGVRGAGRLGIVVATKCLSDCTPLVLVESEPFVVTRAQQAIRMVARERADGGADIDCWLFDTANPADLQEPPKVTATVDATQWGTDRPRVGLFAKNTRASAAWFEVLSQTK